MTTRFATPYCSVHSPWTIVLAAGEGRRLLSLTRALYGEDLPKQFATIHGCRSLLQETISRALRWSLPSRVVVVVGADREEIAREQLRDFRDVDVVAQPQNLGTGPGVLLPLSRVLAKDARAQVVILPSDHYVALEEQFAKSVLRAEHTSRATDSVTLLGALPDRAETEYGWILPKRAEGAAQNVVARFHEKPAAPIAEHLMKRGALWNTFIMAGPVRRFWDLGRKHLPLHCALLDSYRELVGTANEANFLREIYARLPPADFSRDVIEKANGLSVMTLDSCGWSDWGTPERVLRSLEGTTVGVNLSAKLMHRAEVEKNLRVAPTNAMTELVEA
jgi:mannose-1-phosphate guanylyltransferase